MSTPVPPPAAPDAGGSLVSKVGGPRNAAIIGAGLTVAVVALFASARSKGATGTTTTMVGDTAFDSGPYDMWNQWQQQFEELQGEIQAQQGGQTSAGGGTPKPIPTPLPAPIPKPPVPPPAPHPPAPKPKPKPGPAHPPTHKTVIVKRGDTLSGIAARNHISMSALKKLNPVYWTNKKYRNGNLIWAGDKVRVS